VAARGAATVIAERELDGRRLAEAVAHRVGRPFPAFALDVAGARRTTALLEAIVEGRA
jgi:hypothetical protein